MSNPISFCDECFSASYPECEDLNLGVGLAASTAYKALVTNHFGQKYEQNVTSDGAGSIVISIDGFPTGFFNPYSGSYKLEVTDSQGYIQNMTIAYGVYSCLSFDVYSLNDAN